MTSTSCYLVTGATGFIGDKLVRSLARQGHQVRALSRRPLPPSGFPANVTVIHGSLEDPASLARTGPAIGRSFATSTWEDSPMSCTPHGKQVARVLSGHQP
jgi:uncharacterized protein YbjT (DUF2867 family)